MRSRTPLHNTPPGFPSLAEERSLLSEGYRRIAGIDEAGRGSWAGPLVAAAVCLPVGRRRLSELLAGVRDSKMLTPATRVRLYSRILQQAVDVGVGIVSPSTIDRVGLTAAGELAMRWAIDDMASPPDCLLIDAFTIRGCPIRQCAIVRGDQISLSIAAASIVAKVARDRIMERAEAVHPGYALSRNKGYGTRLHREAVLALGASDYHRWSFSPIRDGERTSV